MKRGITTVFVMCAVAAMLIAAPATALGKTSTKLTVSVANGIAWEHYGYTPELNVSLKTSGGSAVKSAYVTLYCNGVKKTTKKTNSSGKATFVASTASAGDYHGLWQIKYSGSSKYKSCVSSKKRTDVDIHYLGEEIVPALYDFDGDAASEYVTNVRLKLYANQPMGLYTSAATVRTVYSDADPNTDIYANGTAATTGEFTPTVTGYYDIWMESTDDTPMNTFLW
jgi:hypothetical protein